MNLGRALNPRRNPRRARSKAEPGRSTAKMRCSQEGLAVRLICRTHSYPAASLSHCFGKIPSPARSPVDALIDLVVGGRLRCQIPFGLNVHPVIRLRIAVIPQRRPACLRNINPTPALEEADREWLLPVSRQSCDLRVTGDWHCVWLPLSCHSPIPAIAPLRPKTRLRLQPEH